MRLLNTHTLKLHSFTSPEVVKPGYAILSHVWNENEQSFQDLQGIHDRCAESGEDPRQYVSPKIRRFCEVAAQEGYEWAWVDTCCIDKTSSAELSEAINSMFTYYRLALVCFAYLRDVPTETAFTAQDGVETSPFGRSRWHTRGWTLQELIAPRVVLFFSATWNYLGSKADLAEPLEVITCIPAAILLLQRSPAELCIAQRMSWAARRVTTRMEDEAYCLLGIFGVNMPTLYGEGRNAFQRLQKRLMKQYPDTTLFAWGFYFTLTGRRAHQTPGENLASGLFADSPLDFEGAGTISYGLRSTAPEYGETSAVRPSNAGESGPMTFSLTPHGVHCRIPLVETKDYLCGDLSWWLCDTRLLLILQPCPPEGEYPFPSYKIGMQFNFLPCRMFQIVPSTQNGNALLGDVALPPVWTTVYLVHHIVKPFAREKPPLYIPANFCFSPPIRIPENVVRSIEEALKPYAGPSGNVEAAVVNASLPWLGYPPTTIKFSSNWPPQRIVLRFQYGRCIADILSGERPADSLREGAIWANIRHGDADDPGVDQHDCLQDHILAWPGLQKQFTGTFEPEKGSYGITVTFAQSSITNNLLLTDVECALRGLAPPEENDVTKVIASLVRLAQRTRRLAGS